MIPFEVRLSNFLGAVAFAADEKQQRAVWVDGVLGLTSIISIGEFYCQFFDDNDMDDFIANELSGSPLSAPQKTAVIEFRAALNRIETLQSYQEDDDRQTLETPEWRSLVQCAKRTLSVFVHEA